MLAIAGCRGGDCWELGGAVGASRPAFRKQNNRRGGNFSNCFYWKSVMIMGYLLFPAVQSHNWN